LLKQRKKRQSLSGRSLLKRRKVIIEPIFAWIKRGLNFTRLGFVVLDKAQVQWSINRDHYDFEATFIINGSLTAPSQNV
jgi:hypothetical protein